MVQGIIIIAVFLFFAVLMYRQKIPSFLALLLMAIIIPLVAGAPLSGDDSILGIVNTGSYKLASSIPALLFGAWVGEIMNQSGITKDIIRRASELADAMECRCYHGGEGRTRMKVMKASAVDYLATAIFALLLAAIIFSNTYCQGIIYSLIKG